MIHSPYFILALIAVAQALTIVFLLMETRRTMKAFRVLDDILRMFREHLEHHADKKP